MRTALALSGENPPDWLFAHFPAGVGLVRGEYPMRDAGAYITLPEMQARLTGYLTDIAGRAGRAPVWYRTSDLEAQEAAVLRGVDEAFLEPSPQTGTRGIRRAMRHPEAFQRELESVAEAQRRSPALHVLFPFVSTPEEAAFGVKAARAAGVAGPLGLMAETPAAVVTLPELLDLGYEHVLVGCNDLWSTTMAATRGPGGKAGDVLALTRMIELARRYTSAAGATLYVAGYLDDRLMRAVESVGADAAVLHYSQLPQLLGETYASLPDLGLLADIKARTRAAVADLLDAPDGLGATAGSDLWATGRAARRRESEDRT